MKKICVICGYEFQTHRSKQICCSEHCSKIMNKERSREWHRRQSQPKKAVGKADKIETIAKCRHEDCKYRAQYTCDYILHMGHSRGCSISECDKYEPYDPDHDRVGLVFGEVHRDFK